jgi:hypothetical protein
MANKNMQVKEFVAEASTLPEIVLSGDIVRVDCGEKGEFVMLEEPEYNVLRDALATLIKISTDDEALEGYRQFLEI